MATTTEVWFGLCILVIVDIIVIIASGIPIIRPYQKGLVEILGSNNESIG